MAEGGAPLVLCVDDEPNVLEGLARHLRGHFRLKTSADASAALEILSKEGPFSVIVSDFRMPGMDGVTLLRKAREASPDTVRVLLTGQADMNTAIAAVNEGHIFRFLSKPCPVEDLVRSLQAAVEQHRLITAERFLLRDTLQGAIKILIEVLSLVNPFGFGRATRAKQHVSAFVHHLNIRDAWPLEVAAMLSQIGTIVLPRATVKNLYHGLPLSTEEQLMVNRIPEVSGSLISKVPRLEQVREILLYQSKQFDGAGPPGVDVTGAAIPFGARLLKIVLDFDVLKARGLAEEAALTIMKTRTGWYDPGLLDAFHETQKGRKEAVEERTLLLKDLEEGMVFAEDVKTTTGMLLIARGHEATLSLLERVRNFSPSIGVKEPIKVIVREMGRVPECAH